MGKNRWALLGARGISNLIVVLIGITFYLVVSKLDVVRYNVSGVMNIISPFITGFAIAYLLNPPMRFVEEKLFHGCRGSHGMAIATVYFVALLVLTVLLKMVLPQVGESIRVFAGNVPAYLRNLDEMAQFLIDYFNIDGESIQSVLASYNDVLRQAVNLAYERIPDLVNMGVALGSGLISGITAIISSVYMLASKKKLIPQVKRMIYAFVPTPKANVFLHYARRANRIFTGFINGKIIDSAIIGVLCYLFARLLRIDFPLLISVIVGITNIIPFFGPIVGAVPCMMILLLVNPWAALRFGLLIIVLQQFDGNILGPKILGDSTGLSPVLVLLAIVVGGGLFGFMGMILGVPTFALIYSILRDITALKLKNRGIDQEGNPLQADEEFVQLELEPPEK